jgi:RsmE family RNA methyltransferase
MDGEALTSLLGSRGDDVFQENNDSRIDKLELQAIEASEQCERLGIPTISCDIGFSLDDKSSGGLLTVRDVLEQWCREGVKKSSDQNDPFNITTNISTRRVLLICRERGNGDDAVPVLQALHRNERVSFLVGPEGGWSADEEELFDDVCSKFADQDASPVRCVSLRSSVLRAETACLMAVGAWALTERQ